MSFCVLGVFFPTPTLVASFGSHLQSRGLGFSVSRCRCLGLQGFRCLVFECSGVVVIKIRCVSVSRVSRVFENVWRCLKEFERF